MTEKSVFREAWSPRFCTPPEVKFDAFGKRVRKIAFENFSSEYISVRWGDLIEQIKKIKGDILGGQNN